MSTKTDTYQAYLLRFWRRDEAKPWRVTVQCIGVEQHYYFAAVEEAINFIMDQLETPEPAGISASVSLDQYSHVQEQTPSRRDSRFVAYKTGGCGNQGSLDSNDWGNTSS